MRQTMADCFNHFGVKKKNPRKSWSARSTDGNTVVLALWKDLLRIEGGRAIYDNFGHATKDWAARTGNQERLADLKWASQHCGGLFRVVIIVAEDVNVEPREIADCYTHSMTMRIVELEESTGEFRAESV